MKQRDSRDNSAVVPAPRYTRHFGSRVAPRTRQVAALRTRLQHENISYLPRIRSLEWYHGSKDLKKYEN